MIHKLKRPPRRGASTVEAAVVAPFTLFLVFAILIGAMGIFKYQEVAFIARETARFASVHGAQYARTNAAAIAAGTLPTVDRDYLISYAKSKGVGMDPNSLQVTVQMTVLSLAATDPSNTTTVDWDDTVNNQNRSPYSAWTDNTQTPPKNVQVDNVVIVTVTYTWSPGLFLPPVTLTSTSVMPVSY
jgi:hypothetical protein